MNGFVFVSNLPANIVNHVRVVGVYEFQKVRDK